MMTTDPNQTELADLFRQCRSPEGSYDELHEAGTWRDPWQFYIDALSRYSQAGIQHRHQEIQRLLRENGVTYNLHGQPGEADRPWHLDPIPLLIDSRQWQELEAGLVQRALLMDLILKDLYGPRDLIRSGVLPSDLIYANQSYCRPCDGFRQAGPYELIFYAVDLARNVDGGLKVLADRTEAPTGAGYAVENRTIMDRIFPDLLRDCRVRRLSSFFRTLRNSLEQIAPTGGDHPRIVLLTPGPGHKSYFEHAYLSAYLGYPLVRGDDLTIRSGRLWLKSLEGLKPVDIVFRWVNGAFCDPLELLEDSRLGVAGLLEAVRRGQLSIANPVGSSVLEHPALPAFLPAIARQLLDQDLSLPSLKTWWCGNPQDLQYVLERLDRLVIKGLDWQSHPQAVFGPGLNPAELETWRERIRNHPRDFVGQEAMAFSSAPSWADGHLEPRFNRLRCFLTAGQNGFTVMPGGLTLSADSREALHVSPRKGGISKDAWVIADEPQLHISLWQQPGRIEENLKSSSVLPSRAAENLFWVGRYAERADGITRLLRTILRFFDRIHLGGDTADAECTRILLQALSHMTASHPGFIDATDGTYRVKPEDELLSIITDPQRPGSLISALRSMLRAAYAVRHLWSMDSWRVINGIEILTDGIERQAAGSMHDMQADLDRLITALMAFAGLNSESMSREQGWLLLDTGRRIERSLVLAGLLASTLAGLRGTQVEHHLLEALLATTENIITYRHRYRSFMHLQTVLDLVLLDSSNPRSLVYQLNRLQMHIVNLPRERIAHRLSPEERLVHETASTLQLADIGQLTRTGREKADYTALCHLCTQIRELLTRASDTLAQKYFSHAQRSRPMTDTRMIIEAAGEE